LDEERALDGLLVDFALCSGGNQCCLYTSRNIIVPGCAKATADVGKMVTGIGCDPHLPEQRPQVERQLQPSSGVESAEAGLNVGGR